MNETVCVEYTTDREVFVDQQSCGFTNSLMTVETGTHTFDLGLPRTYLPVNITQLVSGTSPIDPLIIKFDPEL